jgi:uncharacterized membrane protein YidH (DUF202 family)
MDDSRAPEDAVTLKLEFELERLDRQWLEEEQRYSASACGNVHGGWIRTGLGPAHPGLGIVGAVIVIVFGLVLVADPAMFDVGLFAIIAGIVTLGVAGAMLWHRNRNRSAYDEARGRYEGQRQELLQAIAASRESTTAREETDRSAR